MHRLLLVALLASSTVRAQEESRDPKEMSAQEVFAAVCARCHGEYGRANPHESVLANFENPPRDFRDPYFNSRERRRDWYDVIALGGAAKGLSTQMPGFADQLTPDQIADLVDYLKAFVDEGSLPQGETAFFRAHFVTKAFPEQEALIIPDVQRDKNAAGTRTRVLFEYTQRFADAFQAEVKAPVWNYATPGDNVAGVGDVELGLKWAAWSSREVPAIASVGFDVGLPTGDAAKGFGEGAFLVAPWVAGGVGIKSLLQLQLSTKLEAPLATGRTQVLVSAAALTLTLPRGKQGFFPSVELLSEVPMDGSPAVLSVVPALYTGITKLGHVAVSVGTELPLVGDRSYDYRIVAFFLWEYADGGMWW